jgi:hypothetical protein
MFNTLSKPKEVIIFIIFVIYGFMFIRLFALYKEASLLAIIANSKIEAIRQHLGITFERVTGE